MAVDRQSLMLFIIVFIFLTLPNGNNQPHSTEERNALTTFHQSLTQFRDQNAKGAYHLGYGNVTGFELSYDDAQQGKKPEEWPIHKFSDENPWVEDQKYSLLPNSVSDDLKQFWGTEPVGSDALGYLFNISGRAYGLYTKLDDVDKVLLKLPEYLQKYLDSVNGPENNDVEKPRPTGDIKNSEGRLRFTFKSLGYNYLNKDLAKYVKLDEDRVEDAVLVRVQATMGDYAEVETDEIDSFGVYFQDTGAIVSTTSSGKFFGLYGLAHLTLGPQNFGKAQKLMVQYLNGTQSNQISMDDVNAYIGKAVGQCEYISYIQLDKTQYLQEELRIIDEELENPTGIPLSKPLPEIRVKEALMYSPDCGVVIKSVPKKSFVGDRSAVVLGQLRKLLVVFLGLVAYQMYLFMDQIKRTHTPGSLSNVAAGTLLFLQYEDCLVFLVLMLVSLLLEDLYLILCGIMVLVFVMCGVFEMGFIAQVYNVQANERATSWWEILRGSIQGNTEGSGSGDGAGEGASGNAGTDANAETGNTTGTTGNAAATPTNPPNPAPEQFSPLFSPVITLAIISTLVLLNASMWRKLYRRAFEVVGLTIINSYWIPQFLKNTLKNCRTPFTWKFLLGTSFVRLCPVVYLNVFKNPLRHEANIPFAIFISCWVLLQLGLLLLQRVLGARFWLNDKWLPKAYNYHPVISLHDLEQGYGSDLLAEINVQNVDDAKTKGDVIHCEIDCAICMAQVDLPVYKEEASKLPKFADSQYMVTPCFHIFHSECLQDWMKYKLQCPVCRNGLPPI